MKIIYLADVHGDFLRVKDLLAVTDAQVYIVAGDLIDRPFFTEEMAARYRELQSYFFRLQPRMGNEGIDTDDFVEDLLRQTDLPGDILANAREYQEATIRARRVLQQKYKVLESILSLKRNSLVFCLPGNYDLDLQYTSLHNRDLHVIGITLLTCESPATEGRTWRLPASPGATLFRTTRTGAWARCTAFSKRPARISS
jgi:Icc-related predicted phosphoesterase